MKRLFTLVVGAVLSTMVFYAQAQNTRANSHSEPNEYKGLFLGASASTNGWGVNARYAFNHRFSVKTGFETLAFTYNFDFDEYDIDYNADLDYKTGGIFLLADFAYAKNLYLSAGVVFNSFNPEVTGLAAEDYAFGDIIIPAEDIGTFDISVEPSLKAAPYFGAGYQSFWGKSKSVCFNFEVGFYYMGTPEFSIESDGLLSPTSAPEMGQAEYLEDQFSAYTIYPVIKLNLAVRIF